MTLPEESRLPSPTMDHGHSPDPASPYDDSESRHQWDINDTNLPMVTEHEVYQDWPNGHCKHLYIEDCEEARRHSSGWAMRNTNNHNVNILKKSCLGVLVCSRRCTLDNGDQVHMRPAICDKARKKQLGKPCPSARCDGRLELQPCRGHCGYPVTHFWRHVSGYIFFQAKGVHDHAQPDVKNSTESRRHPYHTKENKSSLYERRSRKRSLYVSPSSYPPAKIQHIDPIDHLVNPATKDMMCSCPPFECICQGVPQSMMAPSAPQSSYTNTACAYTTTVQTHPDPKASFIDMQDLPVNCQWKDSYNEYIDFGNNEYVSNSSHIPKMKNISGVNYNNDLNISLNNLARNCSSEFSPSVYINGPPFSSPPNPKSDMTNSTCMYSRYETSDPLGPNCQQAPQTSPMTHGTDMLNTSRGSDSGFMSLCGQQSPTSIESSRLCAQSTDNTHPSLDDFDITNPADILSLDQPINKDFAAMRSPRSSYYSSCTKESDSKLGLTTSLDLSALLPSITSFLDEAQENIKQSDSCSKISNLNQYLLSPIPRSTDLTRTEIHSPLGSDSGLSPCRASSSPHSFTELQPVHKVEASHPDHHGLKVCTPTYTQYPVARSGAFQPYTDHHHNREHTFHHQEQLHAAKQQSDMFDSFSFFNGDIYSINTSPLGQGMVHCG